MLRQGIDLGCQRCHRGTLILVGRAGRVACHEGVEVAVPSDFMIPTCNECGAERWDAERLGALAAALKTARKSALRGAKTQEMDPIPD